MNTWILVAIIVVLIILLLTKKTRKQVVGICAVAIGLDTKKRERKERILKLLEENGEKSLPLRGLPLGKGELSNEDIREALGVSRQSVVRYMDELEREGKVKQIGNSGRGVTYRINDPSA